MGWFAPSQENTPQHWFLLFFVSFLGLGRFGVRGEFSRWVPPYSIKGLWEPGGSGLQSSLRSDLANTPQHWHLCFFECFCWVGTIWGKGGIPKVVPPLLVRGTLEAGGRRLGRAGGSAVKI